MLIQPNLEDIQDLLPVDLGGYKAAEVVVQDVRTDN